MLKIVTEAGGSVGFGHVGRCLPIIQAAQLRGVECELVVALYGPLKDLGEFSVRYVDWHSEPSKIGASQNDQIVLDSLQVKVSTLDAISEQTQRILIIDDLGNKKFDNYERVDWSIRSHLAGEEGRPLASLDYVPLRRAFTSFGSKVVSEEIGSVLVTFGGSDIRNMCPRITEAVWHSFPAVEIVVLVGEGFQCRDELEALEKRDRVNLVLNPDDFAIRTAMEECDIAVASGGHSIFELAAAGLPTVHLLVVENQESSEHWKETGFTKFVGWYSDVDILDKVVQAIESFSDYKERLKSSTVGQELVSGRGAEMLLDWIEARWAPSCR